MKAILLAAEIRGENCRSTRRLRQPRRPMGHAHAKSDAE
jgi:hypothetical protein